MPGAPKLPVVALTVWSGVLGIVRTQSMSARPASGGACGRTGACYPGARYVPFPGGRCTSGEAGVAIVYARLAP